MNQPVASAPTPGVRYVDEAFLNAKLEVTEARTETKFAQLLGELKVVTTQMGTIGEKLGKIDDLDKHVRSTRTVIIGTIVGAAIAIVGLSYAAVQIFEAALSLHK